MIKANEIKMVSIESIVPNPKNNNLHPPEQIKKLAKVIEYQGFREPLVVSNRSGFLICGHGRLQAAKLLKLDSVPVMYQDFESEAQEYAHMTADNTISRQSMIDMTSIMKELDELKLTLPDIELLGLTDNVEVQKLDKVETKQENKGSEPVRNNNKHDYILYVYCKDELELNDIAEEMEIKEFLVKKVVAKKKEKQH